MRREVPAIESQLRRLEGKMDSYHTAMISALIENNFSDLICPEYLCDIVAEKQVVQNVIPYCLASEVDLEASVGVIIHKGLMHRLSYPLLKFWAIELQPVFANPVFVVLSKNKLGNSEHVDLAEILASVEIINSFIASWGRIVLGKSYPSKAVIVSAWNVGNIGDDAVTLSAEYMCKASGYKEVVLLGPNGDYEEIRNSDLVVIGGGGLIYDENWENVSNYTAPAVLAKNLGIPFAILGVGTQGINKQKGSNAFRTAFEQSSVFTVRDVLDVTVLRDKCGINNVLQSADLAFALPKALWQGTNEVQSGEKETRKIALVSLSKLVDLVTGSEGLAFKLCVQSTRYLTLNGYHVILAQHSVDDAGLYDAVTLEVGCERIVLADLGIKKSLDLFRSASLVLTSRFHGVVFSSLARVPVSIICSKTGKTGRLIEHDLKSLRPAAHFISKDSLSFDVEHLISTATIADMEEVDRRCVDALHNTTYLKDIYNRSVQGVLVTQSHVSANDGVFNDAILYSSVIEQKTKESTWFVNAKAWISYLEDGQRGPKDVGEIIDLDGSDLDFRAAVDQTLVDSSGSLRTNIQANVTRKAPSRASDIKLVKLETLDAASFLATTRNYCNASILVKHWPKFGADDSVASQIGIEVGLKEYAVFVIVEGNISHLPIYEISNIGGTLAFIRPPTTQPVKRESSFAEFFKYLKSIIIKNLQGLKGMKKGGDLNK